MAVIAFGLGVSVDQVITGLFFVVKGPDLERIGKGAVAGGAIPLPVLFRELLSVGIHVAVLADPRGSNELSGLKRIVQLVARYARHRRVPAGQRIDCPVGFVPDRRGKEVLPIVTIEA